MPELPEVETVRRGLAPVIEGASIVRLELSRPDLRFPFPLGFADRIEGARLLSISRRGKYLIAELDNETAIIMHLGMSGSFRIDRADRYLQPGRFHHPRQSAGTHDHVVFRMLGDDGPFAIIYNDPRRFGFMDLARSDELRRNRHLAGLGIDPVGNEMSAPAVALRFRGRTAPLKSALLDQRLIAGLGNIYVCEALWHAGLSPFRPAGSIVKADGSPGVGCERLVTAIRDVLLRAIHAGGSSLRDHRQADGSLGYFQHSFCVYDRAGRPCQRASCRGVVARAVQSSRSTFWCSDCQG